MLTSIRPEIKILGRFYGFAFKSPLFCDQIVTQQSILANSKIINIDNAVIIYCNLSINQTNQGKTCP